VTAAAAPSSLQSSLKGRSEYPAKGASQGSPAVIGRTLFRFT
jgi:hypothetical protein